MPTHCILRPVALISLSLALIACGGGGGESNDSSANDGTSQPSITPSITPSLAPSAEPNLCEGLPEGELQSRTRYQAPVVIAPEVCQSEQQTRLCEQGALTPWTGSFEFSHCEQQQPDNASLPLWQISDMQYLGGFRLSSGKFGDSAYPNLNYSPAAIAFNPNNQSLFVVGHDYEQGIAEFAIPEVVNSRDPADFNVGDQALQNFAPFHNTDRVDTGIDNWFRVNGMYLLDGQLIVNYMNWYDAGGGETDTSVRFVDASDLANSEMHGPYQLDGAAHVAGWITDVPENWQADFGGTHISGHAHGSIHSRLSTGPSGFIWSPRQTMLQQTNGPVATEAVLDFPHRRAQMLYDKTIYGDMSISVQDILYNEDRQNQLWTALSEAAFGVIIPGTNTYLTIGNSGGHESGIGYKATQDNGNLCGGPCSLAAADNYSYYWLWRVTDMLKVKNGEMEPWDMRPYDYGKLDSIGLINLKGGAYDAETGKLYVAFKNADTLNNYARPPLFLVYQLHQPGG
ncbi:hypothetical protein [Motilimonas sp. KMU-193]|uniref:hypothetical protein n=1 Tax=Motilimonas sp. KMU-193 TaxID=3388668 RepID=UPI00396B2E94